MLSCAHWNMSAISQSDALRLQKEKTVNHSSLAHRYGPLAAVVVIQLLIIVIAPSVARTAGVSATGPGTAFTGGQPGVAGPSAGPSKGTSAGPGDDHGTSAGAPKTGDRSHCVGGRQFAVSIDFFAPPCTPGKPGAAFPNNGGNTYRGVTKDKIEVVDYVTNYGAEVNTILKAEGLYRSPNQERQFARAVENFINSHYTLYGRKINIDVYEGKCQSVPPDYPCLISEMDRVVQQYHPYAFQWVNTVCSACYVEMSRNRVVNIGGAGFSDKFNAANAPYHYDVAQSGSQVALAFTNWWCTQMTSVGSSRRVAFAGHENPTQDFNGRRRVLGVVTPNDPDNKYVVEKVLNPALKRTCGDHVAHHYYYAQDVNTAAQQEQAGTAAMNTPNNPATSVLCLCDPVAPAFTWNGNTNNNYWPEVLIASDQAMDLDSTGQSYEDNNGQATLACPQPKRGCGYDGALGLSSVGEPFPVNRDSGTHVWHASGGTGNPPYPSEAASVTWSYFNMLASLIEATGPILTPDRMAKARLLLGARGGGGSRYELRSFGQGDWTWVSDDRVVYWDKNRRSPNNGKPGTYVWIEGRRFQPGGYPRMSQPPAPPAAKRG
jgi:hypothetical protein